MQKDTIKKIIIEGQERITGLSVIKRDFKIDPAANYIFTGQRRAGKTYFLYQLIQERLKSNTPVGEILYINFEDERLLELNYSNLDLIIESFKELHQDNPVIFFDEIQNIAGWQKFARRLTDSGYQVFVTGSNAQMLSSEMASTLGGRYMIKEITTLSFPEFLVFNNVELKKNYEHSQQRFYVKKLLEDYFYFGGFPETLKYSDKKEYLSNLFQKVFLGDIIARHKVRNVFALKLMLKKLAESTMGETSFNRLKNIINSTGINVGTATLIEYMQYLEESYMIKGISNYHSKITERETKKKYYFRDNGLLNLFLTIGESHLLETLVFHKLCLYILMKYIISGILMKLIFIFRVKCLYKPVTARKILKRVKEKLRH